MWFGFQPLVFWGDYLLTIPASDSETVGNVHDNDVSARPSTFR